MKYSLRPYQAEAVNAVYKALAERDDNPCVVLPTGTGKSLAIGKIASDAVSLWHGRVLVLAHVKELLEQNADKIRKICPEIDIGVYSAGLKSRDTGNSVIVAGIQSVYNKADKLGKFDLIIVDECHLIPPDGEGIYRTFIAKQEEMNPAIRIIGFTATPYRLSGGLICKPDNILNHICYEAGLKEMIVKGYLSPLVPKGGNAPCEFDKLHIRNGEFVQEDVDKAVNTNLVVTAACKEIVSLTKERNAVLIFGSSISHCQKIKAAIEEFSGEECGIVTGDTPAEERADIIARIRHEDVRDLFGEAKPPLKFLVNMGVLTTGFDAPNIDCVAILRPTASPGLLVQMVGRGVRLSPETGKKNCISEGTMILTDHGLVPIEKITTKMKLWDGVEYVSHDGAIYRGEKNVIEYAGLFATPDHKVWSEHHWRTFGSCALSRKPISCTGIDGKAIRETDNYFRCCDCEEIQYTIKQTKRRVWDILNAGPRHRFTANGLLVSNCMVLDYGENIMRHGPLDAIKVRESSGRHDGHAPVRKCPQCSLLMEASRKICPECGYEFTQEEARHQATASDGGLLLGESVKIRYDVQGVRYMKWQKQGNPEAPPTLCVEYQIGLNAFQREWICPQHTGYAYEKFQKWWLEHRLDPFGEIPLCTDEALEWAKRGDLKKVKAITVKKVGGEKYDRIIDYEYNEQIDADTPSNVVDDDTYGPSFARAEENGKYYDDLEGDEIPF